MRIALLDPGLARLPGHHFDLDLRLAREFTRRGHEVELHGSVRADQAVGERAGAAGMPLRATFRHGTYDSAAREASGDAYRQACEQTATDLDRVTGADLWVWPTLTPCQFAAAVAVAGHRDVPQFGGAWWLPGFLSPADAASWGESSGEAARRNLSVVIGAYDDELAVRLRPFSGDLGVAAVPCPHDGARPDVHPVALRRIGFFGHQRNPRGAALMPALVKGVLERGYEVVLQDSGPSDLRNWVHPRLEVLKFVDHFAAQVARCDLAIWPSRASAYLLNCSGVVSECIATGVPVLAPSGCLPAQLMARFGTGAFFDEFSVEAILAALDAAARDFSPLAASARSAATAWHAVNGTGRLCEWLELNVAGKKERATE